MPLLRGLPRTRLEALAATWHVGVAGDERIEVCIYRAMTDSTAIADRWRALSPAARALLERLLEARAPAELGNLAARLLLPTGTILAALEELVATGLVLAGGDPKGFTRAGVGDSDRAPRAMAMRLNVPTDLIPLLRQARTDNRARP